MNKEIVPFLSQKQAKESTGVDIESWRNFAQRITKNPFVKEFLLRRDGNKCGWCQNEIKQNRIVHHITYEHSCSYNIVIQIPSPTDKYPNKTRVVPDCKNCKEDNSNRFMSCMEKLVLVHGMCNKIMSETK